jgi:predicted alpha-1,2-mannosidase
MRTHLVAILMSTIALVVMAGIERPEDLVNLLAGTFTDGNRFSTGNTLPLVGRPWGFNHWAPQTRDGNRNAGSWWFMGNEHKLTWLRCTHQPSPWIGDWGWFLFGAQISNNNHGERNPVTFWEPRAATIKPHYFDATVAPLGIRMELTPTDHGAIFRATFPQSTDRGKKRVCFAEANWDHDESGSSNTITGYSDKVKQDRMIVSNFHMYIRAESDTTVESKEHDGDMVCFRYRSDTTEAVVRIATSLISNEQVKTNLNRELPRSRNFNDIASETRSVWNKLLRRVDIINPGELADETLKHLTIFYSCLVRALSFPRRLDEIDENNNVVHYSPYDPSGKVHPGILVTDNGFWDTFRTVYPMLSLLYPDHLGDIISGWLNAYKEGGWLPSWASPGYRNCMVGTYADVVVADALVKKVKGFDYDLAIEALHKDSFTDAPKFAGGAAGKEGLAEYRERGYFAMPERGQGVPESVSRTLDFGFADFAVAKAYESVAKSASRGNFLLQDAAQLMERSNKASTALFSHLHGLMAPKSASGTISNRFNPIEWGNGFTEGRTHTLTYSRTHSLTHSRIG